MVGMWFLSRKPWSEFHQITSGVSSSGSREFSGASSPDANGSAFYLGGSWALLLAAFGVVKMARGAEAADRIPGVIATVGAILGGVALIRFHYYFDTFADPVMLRYGGGGHYATVEPQITFVMTGLLAVVGILLLLLGPAAKKTPSNVAIQTSEAGGN